MSVIGRALSVVVLFFGVARAGEVDRTRAQEEFAKGARAYDEGRYREAAARFAAGYQIVPRPALLFNEAQAWRREFESSRDPAARTQAIERYTHYLALPGISDGDRGEASARLRTLDERSSTPGIVPVAAPSLNLTRPAPAPASRPRRARTALSVGLGVAGALVAGAIVVGVSVAVTRGANGCSGTCLDLR